MLAAVRWARREVGFIVDYAPSVKEFEQEKSGENGEKLLCGLCCLLFKIREHAIQKKRIC